MPVQIELNKDQEYGEKPVKIFTDQVESQALNQLKNLARLPIVHSHIAVMPDVHAGIGATVGTVIPTFQAIIPAAVGVDIGCGMNAVKLTVKAHQLPDNLKAMRDSIESAVPVGFSAHKLNNSRLNACKPLQQGLETIFAQQPMLLNTLKRPEETWRTQMGTLGSGNHFIELCVDENRDLWIMLHSGSRGIGNAIGRYFIALAKKDMQRHQQQLPDRDLAYFTEGSENFVSYVEAVNWAQEYARVNRQEMMALVMRAISPHLPKFKIACEAINCHHNYVQLEQHFGKDVWLTRKGAISARKDELGIIPGSMGAKSFIVKGKGNRNSFCSCSHGAGRIMSRTAAKKRFNRVDLIAQTQGVECRKDSAVIDEIPAAYKDIDQVMAHQSDLVEVIHTLKQVLCIKG